MGAGVVAQHPVVAQRARQIEPELTVAFAARGEAVQLHDERPAGAGDLVVEDDVVDGQGRQGWAPELRRFTGIW